MSTIRKSSNVNSLELLFEISALIVLALWLAMNGSAWIANWDNLPFFWQAAGALFAVNFLIGLMAVVAYNRQKRPTQLLAIAIRFAAALVWLLLVAPYLIGGIQNAFGVHCEGLGAYGTGLKCIEDWRLRVLYELIHFYYITIIILLVVPLGLLSGLVQQKYRNR